jgi:hypothetical protein
MRDTAQGGPDTQAATPNPAGPDCLVGYAADALDHAGRISTSMRSVKAAQSVAAGRSVCCSRAARSPIASTWSSSTSSGPSFSASSSATPRRQANEKVAPRPDAAQPSPSLAPPRRCALASCSAHQDRPVTVGRSQYRQPGSRTSPSIHRQVRAGAIGGAGCRGAALAERGARVIALPSAGRSAGRSLGRRGQGSPPARPPSHQAQAQGSRERLLGSVVAACGAFWPLPKSADSPLSRSWQECTMTACGDVAPVAGNGSTSAWLDFCKPDRY